MCAHYYGYTSEGLRDFGFTGPRTLLQSQDQKVKYLRKLYMHVQYTQNPYPKGTNINALDLYFFIYIFL